MQVFCPFSYALLLLFRVFLLVRGPILSFCHANVTRNALTISECCKMTLKTPFLKFHVGVSGICVQRYRPHGLIKHFSKYFVVSEIITIFANEMSLSRALA